jgi:hypothetical protein
MEIDVLVEPLVSVKLGLEDGGGAVVIVNVQGHGETFDLMFRDMRYLAGVVDVLREVGARCQRVEDEGWDRIAAEFDAVSGFSDDDLQRLLEG